MILVSWHHLGVIVIFIYPHILTYSLAKYLSIHNAKACFSSKRNIETHEKGKSMKQHICQEQHPRRFFRSRNTFGASESACTGKSGSPWAMEPCRPWPRTGLRDSGALGLPCRHGATVRVMAGSTSTHGNRCLFKDIYIREIIPVYGRTIQVSELL